jgi:hypothetical protein
VRVRSKTPFLSALFAGAVALGALSPQVASAAPAPVKAPAKAPATAAAATAHLYVAPTGNDSNAGTKAKPLRSLQRAAAVVRAGTVVHVAPGQYSPVVSRTSGTKAAPIVYRSDVKWGAKLTSTNATAPWWNYGSYVDIEGFDVTGPKARLGLVSEGSYVRYVGNRVRQVARFSACGSSGGAAIDHAGYTGTGNAIIGNLVDSIGPDAGCNTIQGLYVSQSRSVMQNNIVGRVSGWCLHTWHAATDGIISNNLVYKCGVAKAGAGGAIVVGAGDKPEGVYAKNFVVSNNIMMDSWRGMYEAGRVGTGNRFVNNVAVRVGTTQRLYDGVATGTRFVDPQLVKYSADGLGDYRLKATSPMIDRATTLGAPRTDYYGRPRPQGKAPDIGPAEFAG